MMVFWLSLVLVLVNIGLLVGVGIRWSNWEPQGVRRWIFGVNLGLILLNLLVVQSVGQIEAGTRGVVLRFSAVSDKTFGEGLYFKMPFVETVQTMSVQTQAYHTPASAASKDLQDVQTDITVQFILKPGSVNYIYQTLRRDYGDRVIAPMVQESVKATTALFNAEELITQRPHVREGIERTLADRLAPFGIEVKGLAITNFQFSPTFTGSIEAKVVAVQKALEAENKLRQIEIEAKQREAEAVGSKNARIQNAEGVRQGAILEADGQAQAILKVAEAQAKANALVNATLTEQVIRYALVQQIGGDIKVIILPTGQEFILGPEVLNPY